MTSIPKPVGGALPPTLSGDKFLPIIVAFAISIIAKEAFHLRDIEAGLLGVAASYYFAVNHGPKVR